MPGSRISPGRRWAPLSSLALAACLALPQSGCDERLAERITAASERQEEREKAIDDAVKRLQSDPLPEGIREYLDAVTRSDYTFVVIKGGTRRAMNGYDFTAMLETKTSMLGRDIEDAALWLDEIGSSTFFKQVPYLVQLPSGEEVEFRGWVTREVQNHRRFGASPSPETVTRAPARTRARVTAAIEADANAKPSADANADANAGTPQGADK